MIIISCGGGGGGGSSPTAPSLSASFTATTATAGGNYVNMEQVSVSGERLTIAVKAVSIAEPYNPIQELNNRERQWPIHSFLTLLYSL